MRGFHLVRKKDVSGVSGTGVVAEGTEFHDGQCVLSWFGRHHTIEVCPCIADVKAIHGHDGATEVVYVETSPVLSVREEAPPERTEVLLMPLVPKRKKKEKKA